MNRELRSNLYSTSLGMQQIGNSVILTGFIIFDAKCDLLVSHYDSDWDVAKSIDVSYLDAIYDSEKDINDILYRNFNVNINSQDYFNPEVLIEYPCDLNGVNVDENYVWVNNKKEFSKYITKESNEYNNVLYANLQFKLYGIADISIEEFENKLDNDENIDDYLVAFSNDEFRRIFK